MPGLRHPSMLRAMTRVVADIFAACSMLQVLSPRPDHELVDSSRAIVAAAKAGDSRIPEGDVEACRAVVRLKEMHDSYEALLHEAEAMLERVYRSAMEGTDVDDEAAESGKDEVLAAGPEGVDAAVHEEVVAVLKQAEEGKSGGERAPRRPPASPTARGVRENPRAPRARRLAQPARD